MKAWRKYLIFYKFQRAFDIIGKTLMLRQWPNACMDAISWTCECEWQVGEHEQVSMTEFVLEYYLTHGIKSCVTWRNILSCIMVFVCWYVFVRFIELITIYFFFCLASPSFATTSKIHFDQGSIPSKDYASRYRWDNFHFNILDANVLPNIQSFHHVFTCKIIPKWRTTTTTFYIKKHKVASFLLTKWWD
jgi:hypothetical protein